MATLHRRVLCRETRQRQDTCRKRAKPTASVALRNPVAERPKRMCWPAPNCFRALWRLKAASDRLVAEAARLHGTHEGGSGTAACCGGESALDPSAHDKTRPFSAHAQRAACLPLARGGRRCRRVQRPGAQLLQGARALSDDLGAAQGGVGLRCCAARQDASSGPRRMPANTSINPFAGDPVRHAPTAIDLRPDFVRGLALATWRTARQPRGRGALLGSSTRTSCGRLGNRAMMRVRLVSAMLEHDTHS